jgi:hypothetical protein
LKPETFKTSVTKLGVLYILHVITSTFPPNFEFKQLIKHQNADISIILEHSQKCVIDEIEVTMLGKNQNGTT